MASEQTARATRLAPSPTGALHLGNARTFLITWAAARRHGWSLPLRIEDLDTPRVKPGAVEGIFDILAWLGLDWDPWQPVPAFVPAPPPHLAPTPPLITPARGTRREGVLVQSTDLEPYRAAMRTLAGRGLVYPCVLTRAEIERAASAPQEGAHDIPFPRSLRPDLRPLDFDAVQARHGRGEEGTGTNWRFALPGVPVLVEDTIAGPRTFDLDRIVGDFVVWTKRDQPAYQLSVVVDDHRLGVTDVIRGDDLLDSAARQLLLYRALGLRPEPAYAHLPLVLGPDGKRLAKRHGDSRLEHYRTLGVPPEAIVGLIAAWSIPGAPREPMAAAEFRDRFDLSTMPREAVIFTPEDERWLLAHAR